MNNYIKEYLSFSKKERTGIIVLVLLILATIAIPYFLPPSPVSPSDPAAFEKLRRQVAQLRAMPDSGEGGMAVDRHLRLQATKERVTGTVTSTLFLFDPNSLPLEGWIKLGLPERTAQTIRRYIGKGGRFRRADDLYKIYGLKREEADRLLPYVRIVQPEYGPASMAGESSLAAMGKRSRVTSFALPAVVDINTADTNGFIALRGIGPVLARRIVHFREKLGGFHAVDQVGETYGLPDSTFVQIKGLLQCPSPVLRTIDINTADVTMLNLHPYISRPVAHSIVQYRAQHGRYRSVDQLLELAVMTPVLLEKIRPYLIIGEVSN